MTTSDRAVLSARLMARHGERFQLDLPLQVSAGEVVALLGPNGAGKTTALRALAGLVPLHAGVLRLGSRVWDDPVRGVFVPSHRRSVGVVFQDYLLFPHLSALDNVAFGPRCQGFSRTQARQGAYRWLRRVGMADQATSRPAALSGGQAQRVALARALAVEPDLLLLDEPLAALDAETRTLVRAELRHRLTEFPGCALVVTHDPVDAMLLADRLVVIERGRLVQQGDPAEVARRPRTSYVARLVGLNLLRGRAQAGRVRLTGGGTVTVTEDAELSGEVLVAFRPAAVSVYRVPPHGSPRNVWPGTVAGVDQYGGRVRLAVTGPVPLTAEVSADAVAELKLAAGERVHVAVKATEIDVYPA
ncbi:MAG TPA: ABC transporter ATP-binding protein [Micromonosporaceae bacterium]